MRTTLTLDADVFEAAKAQAEASGKTLSKVFSELARRGLRTSTASADRKGLPVFKVRHDSKIIPSGRARELLAEDAA
jgi:hypothetical protein